LITISIRAQTYSSKEKDEDLKNVAKFLLQTNNLQGPDEKTSIFLWLYSRFSPTFALHLINNFSRVGGGI
jgi:hypothetical protein